MFYTRCYVALIIMDRMNFDGLQKIAIAVIIIALIIGVGIGFLISLLF